MAVVVSFVGKWDGKDVARAQKEIGAFADQSEGKLGKFAKRAGVALAAVGAAAVGAATVFGKQAIDAASTMEELNSKVEAIFGQEAAAQISAWSKNAASAIGQSQISAQNAASTFAIFGKGAGLAGNDLVNFSTSLTSLSSDLASFYDASPEEAITAIGAALRGESEPIRRFGVLLDDATLRQKALALGLIETTKTALTPQQRVLAAQAVIMEQTADAQGDFARTSDGLANSQRTLAAVLEDVKTEVGVGLLPAVTSIVQAIGPVIQQLSGPLATVAQQIGTVLASAFEQLAPVLPIIAQTLGQIAAVIGSVLSQALGALIPPLTPVLNLLSELASRIAPLLEKLLGRVAEILVKLLNAVVPLLEPLVNLVFEILDAAWPIIDLVADVLLILVDALAPLLKAVSILIKPLGDLIKMGLAVILPIIQPLLPVIEALAVVLSDILGRAIGLTMAGIGGLIQAFAKIAPFVINNVVKPTVSAFLTFAENIVGLAERAFGWVPGLGDKLGEAKNAIGQFKTDTQNALSGAADTISKEGTRIGQGLIDEGTKALTNPSALGAMEKAGFRAGSELPAGMARGISSNQAPVNAAAAQSVKQAERAARAAAQSKSPSILFANIGSDLVKGLIQGVKSEDGNVRQALQQSFTQWFRDTLASLKTELDNAKGIFNDFAKSVSQSITSAINFSAIAPELDKDGNRVGQSFIDGLKNQVNNARIFADRVKALIAMGLKPEALQQVLDAGVTAGTAIANELIAGGTDAIDTTNALVLSAQQAGDEVGQLAAQNFYGAGVASAQATYDGFRANFGKGGPARAALMKVFDNLAAAAARDVTINVAVTRSVNEVVTRVVQTITSPRPEPRAKGGPVASGSPYLIGEKGPELFVPDVSGYVVSNADLRAGDRSALMGSGTTINVTVNAGFGTDGADVGRQLVDALKKYERRNGPVYVSA